MGLFSSLNDTKTWHYFIVDIKDGKHWLISRLFIFAVLLRPVRALQCMVFVESAGGLRMKLLGIAQPEDVRAALTQKYPWLEEALLEAWKHAGIPVLMDRISLMQAQTIMEHFILQGMQSNQDRSAEPDWSPLGNSGSWDTAAGSILPASRTIFQTR
jgi:hypothetical protein